MDAQQFLAEFGHIVNAPGGLEQLRQMIYNLAITGTLVPQQPGDGDAHILLEQIGQTRQRLIQAKAYKRLPRLESEPIDMPENIRNQYQYYSKAEMAKLNNAGYNKPCMKLEDSIEDYVKNYIMKEEYLRV